jgi:hypothetical protein
MQRQKYCQNVELLEAPGVNWKFLRKGSGKLENLIRVRAGGAC